MRTRCSRLQLEKFNIPAEILPLHSELPREEQERAIEPIPGKRRVVVSTNIAESGITPRGIAAVIDTGLVRRPRVVHGVETLEIIPISYSESCQRAGRAAREELGIIGPDGRRRAGVYIWRGEFSRDWLKRNYPHPEREIHNRRLDLTVLRLLHVGINLERLPLPHPLKSEKLREAMATNEALKLISPTTVRAIDKANIWFPRDASWGSLLPKLGERVAQQCVMDVHFGIMLAHAETLYYRHQRSCAATQEPRHPWIRYAGKDLWTASIVHPRAAAVQYLAALAT